LNSESIVGKRGSITGVFLDGQKCVIDLSSIEGFHKHGEQPPSRGKEVAPPVFTFPRNGQNESKSREKNLTTTVGKGGSPRGKLTVRTSHSQRLEASTVNSKPVRGC